jgi:hypothetical protein
LADDRRRKIDDGETTKPEAAAMIVEDQIAGVIGPRCVSPFNSYRQ